MLLKVIIANFVMARITYIIMKQFSSDIFQRGRKHITYSNRKLNFNQCIINKHHRFDIADRQVLLWLCLLLQYSGKFCVDLNK